jgi:hypothetical protein
MVTRAYSSACTVLRHIDRMDASGKYKLTATPFYFVFATSLATFTILRLLKASTAEYMDENAKESFILGVSLMKRLSTEPTDGPAKLARMLEDLWKSEKAFRNPDGTEHVALRIRTRLSMSPVFDSIWWWREEFGGQQGAYTGTNDEKGELAKSKFHSNMGLWLINQLRLLTKMFPLWQLALQLEHKVRYKTCRPSWTITYWQN